MVMNFLHILPEYLSNVLVFALGRNSHGEEEFVMPNVDHLGFEKVDVFVVDLIHQGVALWIRRAINIGPLTLRYRSKASMFRQEIVTVSKRCNLWNKFNLILRSPAGQVGDFVLFKETAVGCVLVR